MSTKKLSFYILVLFVYSCASIKPPPGGPVDKTAPELIAVNPQNGSINLISRRISIQFSEYMDEASFKNNIKVYPLLSKPFEFEFKGDEISLTLPDSLDSEKTYIIYLNRNIKDEHGNSLAKTIQLAYSTGSNISDGVIRGRVYGLEQAVIHLWEINDSMPDSIFATQPDYITDINENGLYSFSYLAPGKYKVLAVGKSGAGLPLNTIRTEYGLYWENLLQLAEKDTIQNINIRLWKELGKLKLMRGEWSAFNWGRLIFNNELPKDISLNLRLLTNDYIISDSPQYYRDPIDQKQLILQLSDSLRSNSINIKLESLKSDDELLLDSSEVLIQITQEADTSYLQILNPKPNFQIISNDVNGDKLDLILSKPVILSADSLLRPKLFKNDTISILINIKKINPMKYQLTPQLQWDEVEKYQLKINRDGVIAEAGRGLKDSVSTINLLTTKNIEYGTVTGKISKSANVNLAVELFSTKNPSQSQTSIVNSDSQFEFKTIPEGNYSLNFFEDSDKDMKYTFGNAYPNIPSEWFYFYPDTFEVRANWETEIAPINLPEIK